tara:strand:- start:844 stop:1863 length:1020 start_codon:yes stop_codon:yes gene_type:complete
MKIGIHQSKGTFSQRWISYCEKHKIEYKLVNCYSNDIIEQVEDCAALMWHFHHTNYKDALFAKGLLFSLEQSGKIVFPNFKTAWHFDDKIGQKYLLESINAPMVPSFVFYDRQSALKWIENSTFPKVFKLRGGSGSRNVRLAKTKKEAKLIVRKAFKEGFSQSDRLSQLQERIRKVKEGKESLFYILRGVGRVFIPTEYAKMHGKEKGYVYFQDFLPNNTYDIRLIVIGDKAFGLKRMVRKNDFRASGSGYIYYDRNDIDERCIEISFRVNRLIKSQSIAFDFIFDKENNPLIVEISYGYSVEAYNDCPGYWDKELNFHKGSFIPQEWMVQDIIDKVRS